MSFGFGGNNNNTSSGFGGFGSGTSGFGATNNTSTSNSIFGGGNTATSGGFGGGGFGNNTSSPFGAKPATGFGATATTSGGSLFGGNTSTSGGFGGSGFGATNNTSSGFGAGNTGGGMFGQSKPATTGFGGTNTGGSIFGGGNASGGFGGNANNTTASNPFSSNTGSTGFGATNSNNTSTGFGGFGASNSTATNNNGTANTPFSAFQEKDAASNQTSHYQSITFQQPYMGKSFEELRVEDYLQGRRYGNTNGQAGSFGQSTGFGGSIFGGNNNNNQNNTSTGGGLFGNTTNNTTAGSTGFGGFGANNNNNNQQTTGGFGSNTSGGGLFGQNKPAAGGGLFGSTQTSTATGGGFGSTAGATGGGGLFGGGGGGAATGGFGTNQQSSTAGGGLFGNNNQQQNKPAFGGFGTTNTSTGGFGGNTSAGGGLFGSSTNTNTNTGGGLFGSNTNNQQQNNPFGGSTNNGGGLFGNTQNKPATGGGLFGSNANTSNTGGGLFGATNNNQQQSGGLFGSNNNNNNQQQQSGGLFGNNNQNKPATGGGLFGSGTTNTNTGGGLFGSSNPSQAGGGLFGAGTNTGGTSLFGGNTQNKPAGSSLFGGNTGTNAGGGLFGSNNQTNQQGTGGNSLFGGLGQSNNQQNVGNSLFGAPAASAPQQNQLHASLTASPYGNDQLFSSLGQTSAPVGPLATPLNGARPTPAKTPSLLSSTRLNSPIYTPRASGTNRPGTYGISASTYGTPGSAFSSSLTPQQSSLLKPTGSLGSALTSRLAKSMSMNNLRHDGNPREGESLLRPTPGSSSSKYLQTGSMRKLIIDRSLRADLFASPEPTRQIEASRTGVDSDSSDARKRVSFDNSISRQSHAEPNSNNALVRTEEESENESSSGVVRTARLQSNGSPEMQQANGKALTTVSEDRIPERAASVPASSRSDTQNGEAPLTRELYWTKPSIKDLKNMSRGQLSKMGKFIVGCKGYGSVEFGPCDLSTTNLDDICGGIVQFAERKVTVYPDQATKPSPGKGMNVPSTIHLQRAWPPKKERKQAIIAGNKQALEKHISVLRRIGDTKFVDFDPKTWEWTFTVQHYTTYGFEDDDDETGLPEDMNAQQDTSGLSEPPEDDTMQSIEAPSSIPEDDTFGDYKKRAFPRLPGDFEESGLINNAFEDAGADDEHMMSGGLGEVEEAFAEEEFDLPGGAVQAPSPGAIERYHFSMAAGGTNDIYHAEDSQAESEHDQMPGSFHGEGSKQLRSILKPTNRPAMLISPEKLTTESWEQQLQRTISPQKRDRQALKDLQQSVIRGLPTENFESPLKRSMLGQSVLGQSALGNSYLTQKSVKKGDTKAILDKSDAFRTSMDIMNALWAQEKTIKKAPSAAKGFENPYPKKPRLSASAELDEQDAAFHNSLKPSFANNGTFVYSHPGAAPSIDEPLARSSQSIVCENNEIRFAKFTKPEGINTATLSAQKRVTESTEHNGFPFARTAPATFFRDIELATDSVHEKAFWQLASILFDTITTVYPDLISEMHPDTILQYESRLRVDAFASFWARLLESRVAEQISLATTAEEKALLRLTINDVSGACDFLTAAKDFKLATIIAQLPGDTHSREMMQTQIKTWCERNDWGDIPDTVRALYSIVAGEVCIVCGKEGAPEYRATPFNIAERFGLSWMQSLGLRVFFGGHASLAEAANAYIDALNGDEKVLPTPWWAGEDETVPKNMEDTLLGILRIAVVRADLQAVFDAKTISGSALNSRIAWQLATIMTSNKYAADLPDEKLDLLTLNFATELEAANAFVTASWVLLHLRDPESRRKAIAQLLIRNARLIGEPKTSQDAENGTWEYLANENKLPEELLWSAKALHACAELRSAYLQSKYLLFASRIDEAHDVLCSAIGPEAVIEEDFDELQDLLQYFARVHRIAGWEEGGQVFEDFVRLATMSASRKSKDEGAKVMERLSLALDVMEAKEGRLSLEQKVAVVEMKRVLKEELRDVNAKSRTGDAGAAVDGIEGSFGTDAFARYKEALGVVA